ncbi:MAG: methylenetetrahydrofolate--tRNA-(uracil(54)-C(5))-methyltransferase (FADH(2)-oxidizing) TrmFO [Clostridia bacterium]
MSFEMKAVVIGAGLAGSESAYFLAEHGVKVTLIEMKPQKKTPAHKNDLFGELVCSNSLKSEDELTASGLLKKELEILDCFLLKCAISSRVPAGGALAVDREIFAKTITDKLKTHPNITIIQKEQEDLDFSCPVILATGPLTDGKIKEALGKIIGNNNLFFYDAIAPIVESSSVDMDFAFWGNRYDKGGEAGDYINCPMNKEEFNNFYTELIKAKTVPLKEFEELKVFEGCMPVEQIALRGFQCLRFGPMKPVGLFYEKENRMPWAAVQLRKENTQGTTFNLVGFQTNLTFGEQKRIFSMIPALKNAEFVRYGVMHRNSYLNAPLSLTHFSSLKNSPNIFVAGQLSGVEGYMESIASGLFCAINVLKTLQEKPLFVPSSKTCFGALFNEISSEVKKNFQPVNANYGIMNMPDNKFPSKNEKRKKILEESLFEINVYKENIEK